MKQYVIVEKDSRGKVHCYVEDYNHHIKCEYDRLVESKKQRLHPASLEYECDLSNYPSNTYFVFELNKK
jgi:hypothetical protein